jgi:hypothetical protein
VKFPNKVMEKVPLTALPRGFSIHSTLYDEAAIAIEKAVDALKANQTEAQVKPLLKPAANAFRLGLWPEKYAVCMAQSKTLQRNFHDNRYKVVSKTCLHIVDNHIWFDSAGEMRVKLSAMTTAQKKKMQDEGRAMQEVISRLTLQAISADAGNKRINDNCSLLQVKAAECGLQISHDVARYFICTTNHGKLYS